MQRKRGKTKERIKNNGKEESTMERRKVKRKRGKYKGKDGSTKERRKVQRKGGKYKGKTESTWTVSLMKEDLDSPVRNPNS